MKKQFVNTIFTSVLLSSILISCSSSKKATDSDKMMTQRVSYERDLKPIIQRSCAPCHFPEKGKKEHLDTYEKVADHIGDILFMVQLPADNPKFMPYESKKQPLTAEEIELFKTWKKEGMGK